MSRPSVCSWFPLVACLPLKDSGHCDPERASLQAPSCTNFSQFAGVALPDKCLQKGYFCGSVLSAPGQNPFPIIEKYVDEIVLVEDEHIVAGMRALAKDAKLIAEPAASIGLGALLAGSVKVSASEKVCLVLSGGNWDLCDLADIYR